MDFDISPERSKYISRTLWLVCMLWIIPKIIPKNQVASQANASVSLVNYAYLKQLTSILFRYPSTSEQIGQSKSSFEISLDVDIDF